MPSAAADTEALAWEIESMRAGLIRLRALGVKAAVIAMVDNVPLAITQNASDLLPLCDWIVAAYHVPPEATLN